MEQETSSPKHTSAAPRKLWVLALMLAAWWVWVWVVLESWWPNPALLVWAFLIVVASALGTSVAARRHPLAMFLVVLGSPVVVCPASVVAETTRAYFDGAGYIATGGLPTDYPTPDPETGLPFRAVHGCVTNDIIEAEQTIHNGTIRFLVRAFGPMQPADQEAVDEQLDR